jgi:hypothetical protein
VVPLALFLDATNASGFALGACRNNPKPLELISTIKTHVALGEDLLFFTNIDQAEARPRTHLLHLLRNLSSKKK